MTDRFAVFINELKNVGWLEWTGVGFGVAEVLFAKANKIWLYPAGIISVIISSCLFIMSGLYAESVLNLYYLAMSIYGWWMWMYKRNTIPLPISRVTQKEWFITSMIIVAGFVILYVCLAHLTNSTVPFMDAWVSATAWAGMWLLAKRKIENWILLNISNLFAIPLLFYKELPLYALLTIFLFIVAVFGYLDWLKILKQTNDTGN
jgi:nicotinamide mononucleotide transporter